MENEKCHYKLSLHLYSQITYIMGWLIFYTLVEILVCLKGLNVIELILQFYGPILTKYLPKHVSNIPFRKLKAKNYYSIPIGHINPRNFFFGFIY